MIEISGQSDPSLEESRADYIDQLDRFRNQLHLRRKGPSDFEQLGEASHLYAHSFQDGLEAHQESDGVSLGEFTFDEVVLRRGQIAERFKQKPLRLYPDTEALIGASALLGVVANTFAGRVPSAVGSGLLAATSYFSFEYRRRRPIVDASIADGKLIKQSLDSLKTSEDITSEHCMTVFDATLQTEEAAVTRMATRLLAGRTYTPLGFIRLASYNFYEKRRLTKMAKKQAAE